MAVAKAYVLDGGTQQILTGSSGFGQYKPYSYQVGDAAAYVPLSSEIIPRGNIVYTGNANLMQSRIVSTGVTRFTAVLPEGAGPFNVGNVVFYTIGSSGIAVPFIMVVLPFSITKQISAYDTGTVGLAVPGNRLLINITLTQQIVNDTTQNVTINVTVTAPTYTNLSYLDSEINLPAGELMPWNQIILQQTDLTQGPALISKDISNKYWIMPFFKQLHSPNYNVIAGGFAGDNYSEVGFPVLWGHRLKTPNSSYTGRIGGVPLLNSGATPQPVGGAPLKLP